MFLQHIYVRFVGYGEINSYRDEFWKSCAFIAFCDHFIFEKSDWYFHGVYF